MIRALRIKNLLSFVDMFKKILEKIQGDGKTTE